MNLKQGFKIGISHLCKLSKIYAAFATEMQMQKQLVELSNLNGWLLLFLPGPLLTLKDLLCSWYAVSLSG